MKNASEIAGRLPATWELNSRFPSIPGNWNQGRKCKGSFQSRFSKPPFGAAFIGAVSEIFSSRLSDLPRQKKRARKKKAEE